MATYNGTSGNDTYTGGAEDDSISGLGGNDTLRGGAGRDTLLGGNGNDHLYGDDGDDSVLGGTGSDTFFGGRGNDFFDGGLITDRTNYADLNALDYRDTMFDAGGVVIHLGGITGDGSSGTGTVLKGAGGALGTDTVANVNFVTGSNGNDRITLSTTANIFENVNATLGNDTLDGGVTENRLFPTYTNRVSYTTINGPVTIDLRAGTAIKGASGEFGTDTLLNFNLARGSHQNDLIQGSDDPVRAEWFYGEGGNDTIDGRGGFDFVRYDLIPGTAGVTIRLGTTDPQADGQGGFDVLRNIEGIVGSANADTLFGDAQANRLDGRGGNDTLDGGPGDDVLDGGANFDTASYATAPAAVLAAIVGSNGAASGGGGNDLFFNLENLSGSAFNDTLIGGSGTSSLEGGAGNDSLVGAEGSDTFFGGPGNDTLEGGAITDRHDLSDLNVLNYSTAAGPVSLRLGGVKMDGSFGIGFTGAGDDGNGGTDRFTNIVSVIGSNGNDRLEGSPDGEMFEFFFGGLGDDTLIGHAPDDALNIKGTRVSYSGAPSAVTVDLRAGTATGGHGNDQLVNITAVQGSAHDDVLRGADGSHPEHFIPGDGTDTVDGRGGSVDIVRYTGSPAAVVVDLQAGTAQDGYGKTDTLIGIEGAFGSTSNDTLRGDAGTNIFQGYGGNDSIDGRGGIDWVWFTHASAAVSVLLPGLGIGGATGSATGTDTLVSIEAVRASPFDDTLTGSDEGGETIEGYEGNDTIDGRGGADFASFDRSFDTGAVVDLVAGLASNDGWGDRDVLVNIENLIGSRVYADHLTGNHGANVLRGQGGNDTLLGLSGDDTLDAGTGTDSADGGEGIDTLALAGNRADYTVSTVSGGLRLVRSAAGEDVVAKGIERFAFADGTVAPGVLLGQFGAATEGADTLTGTDGDEAIDGLGGNDSLAGGVGNDTLAGGAGDDTLFAGQNDFAGGADFVDGGPGSDTLRVAATRNQYGYINLGDGVARVQNIGTSEVVFVRNVEFVAFSDQTVALSTLLGAVDVPATFLADSLSGGSGADSINALEGNDTVDAGGGDDTVVGGPGNDVLAGGAGTDLVSYAGANGRVVVNLAAGTASGAAGEDRLSGFENLRGSSSASGTLGDELTGDGGENEIDGDAGNDTLAGGDGIDLLVGGAGNDLLLGGAGGDTPNGDGNALHGGPGNDTLDGSGGVSYAIYAAAGGAINANLGTGVVSDGDGGTDTLIRIAGLGDSRFNDTLTGADGDDDLFGVSAGDDLVDGRGGMDFVSYAYDEVAGGVTSPVNVNLATGRATGAGIGTDTLLSIEGVEGTEFNDTLTGGGGDDSLQGNGGNDLLEGGAGFDWALYDFANAAVNANLATGVAQDGSGGTDQLSGIEAARGGAGNDTLVGSDAANRLEGLAGNDSVVGGAGDDTLAGGDGIDTLDGGVGSDWIDAARAAAGVSINLASGTTNFTGEVLTSIENAIGGSGNDTLTGSDAANTLLGGPGDDSIQAGGGNDSIFGGAGRDSMNGGAGDDTLDGGVITDRVNYNDLNFISYSAEPGGITLNFSGISGDGSVGFGTVTGPSGTDLIANVPIVQASNHDDSILGSSAMTFEQFEGRSGNDTIDGGAITDLIDGINSNRVSYEGAALPVQVDLAAGSASGGDGTDVLRNINLVRGSSYADSLSGSAFGGTLTLNEQFEGRGGADTIDGRGGFDVARYETSPTGVVANLATGVAQDGWGSVDTLLNIEGLRGSSFADHLIGGNPANGTTAEGLRGSDGRERFAGGAGNDTLDGGQGLDWAIYFNATAGAVVTLGGGGNGTAQDGEGGTDTLISIEAVAGTHFADRLTGSSSAQWEIFMGLTGDDTIDGGDLNRNNGLTQFDAVDYRSDDAGVVVNLATGTATDGFGGTDSLSGIEFVFGSSFADSVRGADGAPRGRGDTVRGGAGNDTFDGGAGVDAAEFLGNRADYTVTRVNATTWTVRDNNPADGDEGTDTLVNVERIVFNDEMLSFGARAEELARVAAVLWTKPILSQPYLFSRGFSFYDNGDNGGGNSYSFEQMISVALIFWRDFSDADLATRLKEASGTAMSQAQLLQIMVDAGGGAAGREAAVRAAALDPAMDSWAQTQGFRETGLVSFNYLADFGQLFDLWGG